LLKFIGNGSAFNTVNGNNSAYYKEGSSLFMIDCGSDVFKKVVESDLLDGVDNIHILITHSHADHIGSLADLILYSYFSMKEKFKIKASIYSIGATDVKKILKLMGVTEVYYNYTPVRHTHEIKLKDFEDLSIVDIHKNKHVKEIFSFGYTLKLNDNVIYYSGDTSDLLDEIVEDIEKGNIDIAYVDTCELDYEENVHLSSRKLKELIKEEYRDKVWCMHLDTGFNVKDMEESGFNVTESDPELRSGEL